MILLPHLGRPVSLVGLNTSGCAYSLLMNRALIIFRIQRALEKHRFRNVWSSSLISRIEDRLYCPRFGFPGAFDRASPPPKTLHWKHAPVSGEYQKIQKILCWATLHIWLIDSRIGPDSPYSFLVPFLFDYLSNELTSTWLPEASIPSFSVKSEAKNLTEWCCKTVLPDLRVSPEKVLLHAPDTLIGDLLEYTNRQQEFLKLMDIQTLVETNWKWVD